MKRKLVIKLLSITIVSAMLISNTVFLSAAENAPTGKADSKIEIVSEGQESLAEGFAEDEVVREAAEEQAEQSEDVEMNAGMEAEHSDAAGDAAENPMTSETPETPTQPEAPDAGEANPETPETPDKSETPETPGQPEAPEAGEENPGVPENPGQPEAPEAGEENPGMPEKPETPETPEQPETPNADKEKPETPAKPETAKPAAPAEQPKQLSSKPVYIAKPSVTAGIGFYLEELKDKYHITFSKDFAEIMQEIEQEFLIKIRGEKNAEAEVAAEDEIRFTNWQDIFAIYLLNEAHAGAEEFVMDREDKEGLAELFAQMNTAVPEEGRIVIQAKRVEDYLAAFVRESADADEESAESETDEKTEEPVETEAEKKDREFLEKYTSANCALLCAASTGSRGFITASLGEEVSLERAKVVEAAYSLVGKVPYFWGGKSSAIGWDSRWEKPAKITAAGISATGTVENFGLDCSGFVTWAFINGYEDQSASSLIGHGTAGQWARSEAISEEDALPGDLVFLQQPVSVGINHVGIVAGRGDDGKLVVIHCNAGDNGVVVESAYSAGFRYVRKPAVYEKLTDESDGSDAPFALDKPVCIW